MSAFIKHHKNDVVDDDWKDLFAMLDDMKAHALANGQAIIEEDRPHQLRWAWRCTNTGKTWSITILNIRNCIETLESQGNTIKADILRRTAQTQEGKANLLDVINGR